MQEPAEVGHVALPSRNAGEPDMRNVLWKAPALALLLGLGLAACNDSTENVAAPPADEPTTTGSVPAAEPAPVEPAPPPAGSTTQ
jgi:hypothetical protein